MLIVVEPRQEEEVLAPVDSDADLNMLLEDIAEWEAGCVVHLCGCKCAC